MAGNMFIKFMGPNIDGGSSSKGHETEIEIMSWSHGFHQPTSPVRSHGGGGTVEKAHHSHFTFSKQLDSATDDLIKQCWLGKHFEKVQVTCYRASGDAGANQSGVPYLKVLMESVIIADFSIAGSPGDMPHENISLNYAKVTYTYNKQDKTSGAVGADQPVSHDLRSHVIA